MEEMSIGESWKRKSLKPGTVLQNKVQVHLKDGCKTFQTEIVQSRASPSHTHRWGYKRTALAICGQSLASTKGYKIHVCNPKTECQLELGMKILLKK